MSEFQKSWPGPLASLDLPPGSMNGVVVSLRFDAGDDPEQLVTAALKPLLGQARIKHHALVRRSLTWSKSRWEVEAALKKGRLTMKAKALKRSQIDSLVNACAGLPNARDVQIKGSK